jgi:hypothetical protein
MLFCKLRVTHNGWMWLDSRAEGSILRAQKQRYGSPTTELVLLRSARNAARVNFLLLISIKVKIGLTLKDKDLECAYIQGEHKRTLHFQSDTENKCYVLRTSHLHQPIEKHSKFCFK